MPPKPRAKQNRKPAQRKPKPGINGLPLAVDPSVVYTATAANNAATSAMPPPLHAPVPGSMSVPVSDTQMAHEHVDLHTTLPLTSSHGASSGLPSPSLTDEASSATTHAQAVSYCQLAEAAMAFHPVHENTTNQAMSGQNGPAIWQRPVQESNQPTTEATHLHEAMLQAISVLRQRVAEFSGENPCPVNNSERDRYGNLVAASNEYDVFFLILHQQYCCWLIDKKISYENLQPVPPELVDVTFNEFGFYAVFGDDRHITYPHWLWYSKFPGFVNVNVGLDREFKQVRDFVTAFGMNWPEMKKGLLSQMVPLMAYQIRDGLRCASNFIAVTLFTRIRRAIGVVDCPLTARFNLIFNMDMKQEASFEQHNASPMEKNIARSAVMASYMELVQQIREGARRPVSAAPAANPSAGMLAPGLPVANHASVNRDQSTNTNRPDMPPRQQQQQQQQNLSQLPQGPPQSQAHAAMSHQPHAPPPQPFQRRRRPLDNPQPILLPAIQPPAQPTASFQ
ncbi:uncharacterized protein TRIVIDRAFT_70546, partial [Trichoderma virens Gv29-8]